MTESFYYGCGNCKCYWSSKKKYNPSKCLYCGSKNAGFLGFMAEAGTLSDDSEDWIRELIEAQLHED